MANTALGSTWQSRVAGAIEFSVITRQEFDRPFAHKEEVEKVVERWKTERNKRKAGAN